MRFLNWLNRHLGKSERSPNLHFDSFREDSNANLELVRLEDRIVLSVSVGLGGVSSDVLEINLDAPADEATVSVIDSGATIQVEDLTLPGSIMEIDASQVSSILITGTDSSQIVNFLGQENLVVSGDMDLTPFSGDVNIGIQIQVGSSGAPQFNPASTVTYLGQFQLSSDELNVVLPNELNASDTFTIQINGPNLEILDPGSTTPLLFTTPVAGLSSINVLGADGETDHLTLDYSSPGLTGIAISFDGGSGGNDVLEFVGGTFDTVTHNLTGPGTGMVDLVDNGITEISYTGLEPVFGGSSTADNIVINLPTATFDAVLEDSIVPGEMQIRSLTAAFEMTTFASPADSLTINTAGGNSIVSLNSFDTTFSPSDLILSGTSGDSFQLTDDDLLSDSVSLTISGGATLDMSTFNETVDGFVLENGNVIATSGVLTAQSNLDLRSGTVTAQLSGTDLVKNGMGTVLLNAANAYNGQTIINDGTLQLTQSFAVPNTSNVDLTSVTSVLDLNGFEISLTSLTGTGNVLLGGPTGVLTINQATATSSTFAGSITGDGDLNKLGEGEIILSGTNSITGSTDIQNGLFKVEGDLTTSDVSVASGATLGGAGSITAPVSVSAGGRFAPGSSPGIMSTGDLTLNAGSNLDIEIDGTNAGTEYDQVQVTGTVDITGATLNLISTFTASAADEFLLIDNDDVEAVTGTFNGLAEGTLFSFNGNQVYISYVGGDGNDVVLTVNSPPESADQIFDIDENSINTTPVGTIVATDSDVPPDSLIFDVTGGTGQTAFNVSTSGETTVADQSQLDYESSTSLDLEILVTDSAGGTDTATITINLNPLNDNSPVIANQIRNVDENATNGTAVGAIIVASDDDLPGDTLTFSETGGTGATAFDITSSGQIVVADQSLLNFETNPTYTLDVKVDDGAGETATATVTINLNDLSETLFVNPGDWSVNDITLVRDGSQLRVLETGTMNDVVPSHNFASISNVIITGNGSDNITRIELSSADITAAGGINFNGGAGTNTIIAPNQNNDWNITGVNSGSLLSGSVVFSNVQNLYGNNGNDTYVMQDAGRVDGGIFGQSGFDTIDFSADSDVVTINYSTASATTVNLGDNIEKVIGDNTQDRFTGGSDSAIYVINGVNKGVVDGFLDFEGFRYLTGAAGADQFQFTGAGQITGSIDGLSGNDVLNYSASSFAMDMMLTATGSVDGFAGTEASTLTSFDNINTVIGSSNTDSLTGIDATANWSIDGTNQYTSSNSLNFSAFENLIGGTDVDTFTITGSQTQNLAGNSGNDIFSFQDGASLTGDIDGQSGSDTLDYNLFTSSIDAVLTDNGSTDGFQGTESSISNGFDNINRIEAGSGAADKLTGRDAAATWTLQPSSIYASVTSLGFQNFETLQGGNDVDNFNINGSHTLDLLGGLGNDIFQFDNDGSSLNGTIDGEDGSDLLNFTNYTTSLIASLTSLGATDGFNGNESAKSITFQNIDQLTGGSGTNTLTGIDSAANWTLDGTNSYQSTNTLEFSAFVNLNGGTDVDTFTITGSQTNNLAGNSGNDIFSFQTGASLTGDIDGQAGVDVLDYSASTFALDLILTSTGSTNGFAGNETSTLTSFDNINTLIGSGNTDSLTGINATADWSIDGTNQYTSTNTLDFSAIENLIGGTDVDTFTITGSQTQNLAGNSGNDIFSFQDGASLTGDIDGQSGSDTLDYNLFTNSIDAVLTDNGSTDGFQGTESSISNGFDNINRIEAGSGAADKLTGRDAAATWTLQPSSIYASVTSLGFQNFETLQGGNDVDTFNINGSHTLDLLGGLGNDIFQFDNDASSLNGTIDGEEDSDHLNFTNYSTNLIATLTGLGATDGFNGNESAKSITFQNIDELTGGSGTNSLTGINSVANWTLDGTNTYQSTNSLEFSNFVTLQGGNDVDTFNINGTHSLDLLGGLDNDIFQFTGAGQITGSIDGQTGVDVLDYSASSAALDLMLTANGSSNGFAGTETSTLTSFDNINTLIGSGNSDSLTGINATADWSIDGTNQYTSTNTLDFSAIENLIGGTDVDTFTITGSQTQNLAGNSGNDIFRFQDGASLTGDIDGQSGSDTLDYNLFTSSLDVVLTDNGSTDGFQGTETSISNGFDNINRIEAGSGAADKLTGRDAAATWTLQPSSIYGSFTSLGFQNFETLQGGSDVDNFNIKGAHTLDLLGGLGNDIFQFDNDASSLNGTIDGQGDSDHLNFTNYSTSLTTTLTGIGGTDGFDGNESAMSVTFQNMDQLTGGSGTNSLTGINSAANWTLDGTNTYQSTNSLEFSNFVNLTGGTDTDIFNLTPNTEAFSIVGGDPTSNPMGDQLNIDTSAAGTALVSSNGDGSGSVTGAFPTVTYSEIEDFAITGVVDVQIDGTTNNDVIEILVVGPNVEYRLGGILIGSSSLTGTNHITVKGGDGDDSLTVDAALAAEGITIDYDGEGQVTTNPGDVLNLIGTSTSAEYFFADITSGSVRIDGALTDFIVYTGLEPITSSMTVSDITLNYSAVTETITITDAGGGETTVNSTAGELLTFANPTNSLTINTGDGADIVNIDSLAANFTASLTINGEADSDTINANATISLDSGKNIIFNAENINVATGITITADAIALNATEINLDGDLVSATVSGDATTVNVPGSAGGADLQDAVDAAGTGGIINVAAGSYQVADSLRVDESVSILGAGKDVVQIRKVGAPTGSYDIAIDITANNVTVSGAQVGWQTHTSATDYRGYVIFTTADNTTLNNLLFSDNYRSAVVFEGANNLEVSDSIFEGKLGRAAIRDGDGGSGENFLITRNEFREDHFRWGPIAIGPQGTFSSPNNFAFSGEISFNYFGNGLVTGDFQEAGDQNYTVTITNRGMTTDGIDIFHNSFDWQDSSVTNGDGNFAQPGGIYFDPSLSVPVGTVNITDNIFNGFTYDGPQPTAPSILPLWRPAGGQFAGALEFDGQDDFGTFQSPLFDVGTAGTLNLWVNMHDQGQRAQFFEGLQSKGFEFQYRDNGGGQFFGSPGRDGNSNNYAIQSGGASGTENIWQNLQYTWDFNAVGGPQMHIYVDGVEVAYLSSTFDSDLSQWVNTVSSVNQLITVGKDASSGKYFDGLMDDVGWFDTALSDPERDNIRINGVAALSGHANLIAHWDFDQSAGNTVIDNKNGIEITLTTGVVPPQFVGGGQFGGALQFDGTEDFATFQDASFDVGKKGTLNFWVKMEDTGRRNQFFEGPDNGGFEFQYRTNGGGQFFGRTQDGSDYTIQSGGHAGVETFWTNLQYTWDADTGEMHIYLNGVEEPYLSSFDENLSGFDSINFTDTVNGLMNVGRDPGDSSRFFEGLMDDIGWYNEVLNQTERDAIRTSGVTADPRLVAHWNLDDAPGTTIAPGDSGTNIDLYIQAEPPLPPIQGFGVIAPLNANVTYNAFNNNDLDSNVTLDATNQIGDPLYAYASDPLYTNTPSLETQFTIGFGSSAAYFSSEFAADTNTTLPHIGAYQNPPTLYPGLFGQGDIVIFGTGEDDLLELTLTSEDTATFVLTRDVGGTNEVLGTVLLTDITSITFNGLGGDDVLIVNQPDGQFFNPSGGVIFNGGTQNNDGNTSNPIGANGDTLVINHATPIEADSVAYVFTPDAVPAEGEDGVITITDASITDGSTTITFTGLEPILDNLSAADRSFEFTDAAESISLIDDAAPNDNYSFIDSSLSESVLFLNPTNSITIRTDTGAPGVDTITIDTLDSFFDASLSIYADNDDSVTFQSTTNLVTGDLFVTASTVDILADINAASVDISSSGVTSTTFNGGTVTTTGSQLYNNAVNFVTNSTFTSSGGASIEFASLVDGAIDLNINTAGTTIFGGAVGSNTALTSLTTDADGTTNINGGIVNTTANQLYNDDVSLGANATLTSTDPGNITFNKTLNGAFTLDVNTAGITTFNGTVGNSAALTSLTTDADGTTNINGGSVNTTANQTYNDDIVLGANTTLTSTNPGNITFNKTLNGAFTLDVNTAGITNFNGTVGNSTALTSLTTDADGTTNINGGIVNTTANQLYNDDAVLGANTTLTSTDPGNITFNKTLNGAFTLDVNTAGITNFNGTIGNSAALTSLTTDADGTTNINGGSVNTTANQLYNDDVVLGANTTLTSTDPGNITFNKTLNGAFTLDVNTAGITNFNGTVGNSTALTSLTTDADGTTNINGGSVSTTANQLYNDDVVLGANTTLTSTDPGNITFNKTLNGAFTLDVNTAGVTNFNGTVGNSAALTSLTTDADGTTNINGGIVNTTANQLYNDDVSLGANATLTSTAPGNITFNKTLNGAFTLDVNTAGITNFNGTVGNSAALTSLTTDADGTTNINGGIVNTTANQLYNDDVVLGANTTLSSSDPGNITFNKTLNGAFTLDVNTAGITNFNGTVGNSVALTSLTTDADGTTNINGGIVNTTANQLYNDDVVLGANTTLSSTDPGNITFNKTLNGAFTLAVNTAGITNFNGSVGNSTALTSLTTDAAGTTNINGGSVNTTANQLYNDDVVLGANATLTSTDPGNITFNKTLNGAFTLDVNTAGITNFNGTVGNSAALTSLTTDADGTTNINGGIVNTTANQLYNDDVVLGANTTLSSSDPGNITFNKTLNGAFTLDVNTAGITNFNGTVGNSARLTSLTTNALGTTNVNGGSVDTTGAQTYLDAVVLGMSTTFTSHNTGDITFNSTLTGGSAINIDIISTNNIILNGATSTDGNFTANADSPLSGTGDFTMQVGSNLDAGTGTIDIDGANVTTRSVTTTNTSASSVTIDATNGNVITKDNGINSRGDITINATGTVTLEDQGVNTGDGGGVLIQATSDITSTGTGINTTLGSAAGGSIAITSNTGKVDFSNGSVLTGDAGNIKVDAVTGFTALNSTFNTTAGTGSGSVEINVSAGSNSITTGGVTVNGTGTILLTAKGATSDILVSSELTSVDGSISLLADNNISLSSTTKIISQASGSIIMTADNDGSSAGSITMNSGSVVESMTGQIQLTAYDNVAVSAIKTGTRVDITSTNGNITDNDITVAKNVTANQLVMNSNTGIGDVADAIDTAVSFLEADAGTGGFYLDNMGNLTVGGIEPLQVGIDAELEILVNVMGTLDITENVQSTMGESVTFNATDELIVNVSTTIATVGSGAILLTTPRNIKLNSGSNLKTVNGGISLQANNTGTTTGDFIGVEANNATIETTGTGAILITGFGGDDLSTNNHHGVYLHSGTTVSSTNLGATAGSITINGTGGTGLTDNSGVRIESASTTVSSVDGNIQITGIATTGDGVQIENQGAVLSTGVGANAATITIDGTTASNNAGITISSNVQSTDGTIDLTGISNGTGAISNGVQIQTAAGQVTSVNGDITIDGTSNGNDGIQISDSASINETGTGNLVLLGNSTGTGSGINHNATINSNTGTVTLTSEDDIVFGSVALIDSTSGTVAITADNAAGNNGNPISMSDGALIDAGTGDINLITDGNVLLGGLLTTGTVTIDSLSASITDNGNSHTDITASTAILNAVTGIGDGNPLETDISTLTAKVSGVGNLHIDNGIDVELLEVSTFDGDIIFNATATITATSVVSTNNSASESNDISLTATGTNSDILVTTITATGIADVTLNADDGIFDTNDGDTNRITADNLIMTSSSTGIAPDGINVQTDVNSVTAAVDTNPGGLRILEVDDIILTQLTTFDGPITVNAGGTIQAINVTSENNPSSDTLNGISLTATGATSDILITTIDAKNTADITLNSERDILDSDSTDLNITSGDHFTAVAGRNIGGITSIFTETGYDPIQTTVDHLDLTSGNIITIHNTGTSPELINLDAGTGTPGTTFIRATGGSLDVSLTTGISNLQDNIGLVSDTSITVPTGLQTANLRLDAPNIIDAGGGNIDINAVNAILFNSSSAETVEITAQQFDGTTTGSDFVIINDSPALELVDLNTDSQALTGGTGTNVSLTSSGTVTVTNLVSTAGTGTLLIDVTDTSGDLVLNQNIQSATGSVTITTANDIIFNGSNNLTSTSGSVMLTADSDSGAGGTFGGITMADGSFINAGDGATTLKATDDITLSQIITTNATNSAIHLETSSSVIDSGDSTGEDLIANEAGARVTIVSATGVGKVTDTNGAIETQVDQINVTNQTSGEIQIIETDAIIVHDLIQSTADNIDVTTGGNIFLSGLVQTITGNVVLDTQAAIIDQNDSLPSPLNIHALNLDLNAITGIGIGDTLELSVDNLSADTTNGDILLHNTATNSVVATSITTGTGNIEFEQIGNESLTFDLVSTNDGNITISNEGDAQSDILTLTSVTAGGTTPVINVSTIGFGNILLGDVTGLEGIISVTSAGNINDAVDDQVSPEVDINAASGSITLQALNGIGNNDIVELSAGNLTINTTTGNIDVNNLSSSATGAVTVDQVTTGLGTINYIQTGGQSTNFEEISTTDSAITIHADGSMTFENLGALTNVVSTNGTGTIEVTATGVNSSIQINDGFQTVGGTIDLTAENSLGFGTEGDISTANGDLTLLADSASRGVGGGGITMSDGTVFDAGSGTVDLQAGDNIAVGQLFTTTLSRLTSTAGGVTDSGDTGGRDITADELALRTATGIGSANPIETAVSLLAATNSTSGNILIHNDLSGALITISTVDGIAGVTHSGSSAGDIFISNASPLTVNAAVTNSSGGNIHLESTGPGDLVVNAPIRALGGDGNINLEAGDGILDLNDTGNPSDHSLTGTGVFSGHGNSGVIFDSNMTLHSETGAIADIPPDLRNVLTPQIQATGDATVTGDFGRLTEQNFFITIDWGDGTVETTNFTNPGSFTFTHTYIANPNTANPAAPIPIIVTMQSDMQFTFSDGTGNLDFTTQTGFLETPGDGLATVAIDTTPQVPLLLFPPTQEILDSTSNQSSVITSKDTVSIESSINEANKNADRLVFLRILAPNGNVIEDVPIKESDLDNLPKLFKSLPDGRYQLYLKEAGEERIRLLMDVDIRGGKATDVTEAQTSPANNQPAEPDNNTTQNESEATAVQVTALPDTQTESRLLSTVFSTEADHASVQNNYLSPEWVNLDYKLNDLQLNQNVFEAKANLETSNLNTMQDIASEEVWSSAALLSGYFHGKSLLKKPAKQDDFENAMGKYGRRLFNRHYNIFKRNQ